MSSRDQQLKVEMSEGLLTISIGVSEMFGSLRNLYALGYGSGREVVDEDAFARSLAEQLQRADDRGVTNVHYLLDEAAQDAFVRGAEGVRLVGDD